jgi:uncharacterized membrane protein
MAKDIGDRVGQLLENDSVRQLAGTAVSELMKGVGKNRSSGIAGGSNNNHRGLSGMRGVAAGAGAAALAPVAAKGIGKLIKGNGTGALTAAPKKLAEGAGSKLGDAVGDKVTGKIDEAGGPSGILKDAVKSALPFGGGGGGPKGGVDGVGKGRRMPVQQSVHIAVPVETAYNQWTQFEEWPLFMHRVTRVTQDDPCTISFAAKIWGKTKEFTAKIDTQRPDERIKWRVSEGITHMGVVTFHEVGPRLTRIELGLDVQPGSLIEKFARGARHVKRAARADLHRFKAFIEMLEHETGAWRGVIEEGELVEDHDPKYDRNREYGSADELLQDSDEKDSEQDDSDDDQDRGRSRSRSRSRKAAGTRSSSRSRSQGSRSGRSSGSSSGRSGSSGSSRSGSARASKSSSSSRSSGGRSSSRSRSSSNGSNSSSGGSSRTSGSSKSSGGSSRSSGGSSRSGSAHQGRQRTQSRQRTRSSRRG